MEDTLNFPRGWPIFLCTDSSLSLLRYNDTADASSNCWRLLALGGRHQAPVSPALPAVRGPDAQALSQLLSSCHSHPVHPTSPPHAPHRAPPSFRRRLTRGTTTSSPTHTHTHMRLQDPRGSTAPTPRPGCPGSDPLPPAPKSQLHWAHQAATSSMLAPRPADLVSSSSRTPGGWAAICPLPTCWGGPTASCS